MRNGLVAPLTSPRRASLLVYLPAGLGFSHPEKTGMCVILLTATSASLSGMPPGAGAHDGWRPYDATGTIKITAPLAEVMWESLNLKVFVTHQGVRKEIFLAPVARMATRGLEQDALVVGKTITVEAYPSTQNANELRAERITIDGKVVELM